jgi:hypothetical protein
MAAGPRIEGLGFASLFANDHFMPILGDGNGRSFPGSSRAPRREDGHV